MGPMSDSLIRPGAGASREEHYKTLFPQLKALTEAEPDLIANLANIAAAIHEMFGWHWTGFYFVRNEELVLGPFQGPLACTRIAFGKGVCGTAWKTKQTIVVPDVELFPGHIACSALSRSEIVTPVIVNHEVMMVLDIDSKLVNDFSDTDKRYMEQIAELCASLYSNAVVL